MSGYISLFLSSKDFFGKKLNFFLEYKIVPKEVITMPKILSTILGFLAPGILKTLYYAIVDAEKTKTTGPEKQRIVIKVLVKTNPGGDFVTPELQAVNDPKWLEILPILIHAIVQILNLLFGKNWLQNKDLLEIEGSGETPISPKA